MNYAPMFGSKIFGGPELLILAFLGLLMLCGLALFIYSIVAKRYWLTILMLVLPIGLVIVLSALFVVGARPVAVSDATTETTTSETTTSAANASPLPDEPWSESLPPTADIYPSIALCGRPLAYQISQPLQQRKYAVTFVKEERAGDHTRWEPPTDFVADFRSEFLKQFPGSTIDKPIKKAEAESTSADLLPLEIKLSFQPPENKSTGQETTGAISARWTTPGYTRTIATVHFVEKTWVADPKAFASTNNKSNLIVGYSQRLAISPEDAINLALENASRSGPVTRGQITDRFTQKLTLPYGELWQGSVLVDKNLRPSHAMATAIPASNGHAHLGSRSHTQVNGLILITIGLIAIGLISNLLTQGYYRQNIRHTVVTGVAVVFGLLLLVLLVS